MLGLIVRQGAETVRFALPVREVTLGSSTRCDYVVALDGVSRRHARLVPDGPAIRVVDAGSKNGLVVDGRRVGDVLLERGVVVGLGRATLTLEDAATSEIELALTPAPRDASSSDDTGSEGSPEATGATAALRLVLEIGRTAPGRIDAAVRRRVLQALGAEVLLEASPSTGRPLAIRWCEGRLPEPVELEALEAELARFGKALSARRLLPGGHRALIARGGSRFWAALLPPTSPSAEGWQEELLGFLAAQTAGAEPPATAVALEAGDLVFPPDMIVGPSAALTGLLAQVRATVRSALDVLLQGETGTGKELFAKLIHASGRCARGPFVALNCAAIPTELLEAELFGVHGRVATGVDPRPGLLAEAEGGTLFLDEIGELAEGLQAKLLRLLQEREVLPLGAKRPRKVNVRVVSASNRDLEAEVRAGRFRADLYYRLRGLKFHLPPLRERREDLPGLVLAFVERASAEYGRPVRGVSRKALEVLLAYGWPGNVRELQSEVSRAVLSCPPGGTLDSDHFAPVRWLVERSRAQAEAAASVRAFDAPPPLPVAPRTLRTQVDDVEREAVARALAAAGGNKSRAARGLGITRNGLALKLKRLGLG